MKCSDNHKRAKEIYNSWPQWKKDVELTKYSNRDKPNENKR